MQLAAPTGPGATPTDVATAVREGAARLGHRPAVTQLLPSGRQEQSVASLAQWAAKGAHLLEFELGLTAGDRIQLAAPLGWPTAAVALAAWWAGISLSPTPGPGIDVAIVHPSDPLQVPSAAAAREVFWIGDGIDGAPSAGAMPEHGEAWTHAAQPFPDQPPSPRAQPGSVAVVDGARVTSQAGLLRLAGGTTDGAPLGLERPDETIGRGSDEAILDLALLCLRPLLSGRPSVVLRGVHRGAADGERVGRWV